MQKGSLAHGLRIVLILLLLAGCQEGGGGGSARGGSAGTGTARVHIQVGDGLPAQGSTRTLGASVSRQRVGGLPPEVAHITLRVTATGQNIPGSPFTIALDSGTVSVDITANVEHLFVIEITNHQGDLIFRGEATANLRAGAETDLPIELVAREVLRVVATQRVAAATGGEVVVTDPRSTVQGLRLMIPPQALSVDTTFTVVEAQNPANVAVLPSQAGVIVDLLQTGTTFGVLATLTFPYDPALIQDLGFSEASLQIFRFDTAAGQWVPVPQQTVDLVNHVIRAQLTSLSFYTVGGPPPATASNRPPVANAQFVTMTEDTAREILLTGSDADNSALAFRIVEGPASGTLQGSPPTVLYVPDANATGGDAFTFVVNDGQQDSLPATVTIMVTTVNDAPIAAASGQSTAEDMGTSFPASDLTANDSPGPANESGQTLTVTAVAATSNAGGIVGLSSGTITYTPPANFTGLDSFTYTVCDNGVTNGGVDPQCATETVTVTVQPVNDTPRFTNGPDQTVVEDAGGQTVAGWATDISAGPADEAGQAVAFEVTNDNPSLFAGQPAVAPNGTLTYTPATHASGVAMVTVRLHDSGGTANGGKDTSEPQTFMITILAVNDAPSFAVIANQEVNEDAGPQTVNLTGVTPGPANESTQTVLLTAISSNPGIVPHPAVTGTGATRTLSYQPVTNANGSVTITVTAQDDGGVTNGGINTFTRTFTITVLPVNDPPSFTKGPDQAARVDAGPQTVAGWATSISAGPADEAGQTLTFRLIGNTNPALFTAGPTVSATGTLTYTPASQASGTATLTLVLQDSGGTANGGQDTSAPQSFTITTGGFSFPNFSNLGQLARNGSAGQSGNVLRLTPAQASQAGSAWFSTKQFIQDGFTTEFRFQITSPGGIIVDSANMPGADGFAFVIHNTVVTALGMGEGVGIGYEGISNSLAVEFDTFLNDSLIRDRHDPNNNHVSVQTQGLDPNSADHLFSRGGTGDTLGIDLSDGQEHTVMITYTPGIMRIFLDNRVIPLFCVSVDLATTLDLENGRAFVGFTAATEAAWENHDILSWSFTPGTPETVPCNFTPSFTKGPGQTVSAGAGPQTVPGWATGLSAGPADEAGQTLTFVVTNDNPSLFTAQPTVASNGVLTYTPAVNASGVATVTVRLQDSGGTAGGGQNTSAAQTFTITVTPPVRVTSFSSDRAQAQIGADTTLSFTFSGAPTMSRLDPGPLDVTGLTSTTVTPFPTLSNTADPRAFFKIRGTTPTMTGEQIELAFAKQAEATGDGLGSGVAALPDGSVVITGFFAGTATFGVSDPTATTLTATGGALDVDIFVARYAPDGSLIWARQTGGLFGDQGLGVAALPDGSVVITGSFVGIVTFGAGDPTATTLTATGGALDVDIFVARYAPDGSLIWARQAGGLGFERGLGVAALPDGSVVITGEFQGTATFGAGAPTATTLTAAGGAFDNDIFVARYAPDGSLTWARQAGGSSPGPDEEGLGVAALPDGSVVITGTFNETATFGVGDPTATTLTAASGGRNSDIFVARYAPDGSLAWARQASGPSVEQSLGVAALPDGSVVITGSFGEIATFGAGDPTATTLIATGGALDADIFVARYAPDGSLSWARQAGGLGGQQGRGVAALPDGSVVITGSYAGTATFGVGDPTATTLTATGGAFIDANIFVARYAPDGSLVWARQAGGLGGVQGLGVAALPDGSVVITGFYAGTATFGVGDPTTTTLTSTGATFGFDIFLARYTPVNYRILEIQPEGLAFAQQAGGETNNIEIGRGVATLPDGSTIATGFFSGTATFGPGAGNTLTAASDDIFVARYQPDGTLAWVTQAGGENSDVGFGAATFLDGSVVVSGLFRGTATFGAGEANQTVLTTAQGTSSDPALPDIFVARYQPDGTLAWARRAGGTDPALFGDVSFAVAALSDDSTVITGQFRGTVSFETGGCCPTSAVLPNAAGESDIFVARYNSVGALLWVTRAGGTGIDVGTSVTAFPDGSIVVTGRFSGTATFSGIGASVSVSLTAAGDSDMFVARYNLDGTLAWVRQAGGTGFDEGFGVAAFANDGLVVSGVFTGTAVFGPGEINQSTLVAQGTENLFIARYNADGTLAWVRQAIATRGGGVFIRVAAFPDGSAAVTGSFIGTATFGPGEDNQQMLTSRGSEDIFIARYNANGTLAGVRQAGENGSAAGFDIAAFPNGSVAVTGMFTGTATFGSGEANQQTLTATGASDIFVLKYFPFAE